MVQEVVRYLVTDTHGIYVDGTVGFGGHSEAIGKEIGPEGRLICLDRDSEALRVSTDRLLPLGERVTVIKANYAGLKDVLETLGVKKVTGILLDLGVSSYQIEGSGRGFSFIRDEPLDMRMDPDDQVTAEHLVNGLPLNELTKIFREYGEERKAMSIAKRIERERKKKPIRSSLELARLVKSTVGPNRRKGKHRPAARLHPATRVFQALRIAINRELDNLSAFLEGVPPLISGGGRLVVLSYHSLETRLVKRAMIDWEKGCRCPPDLPECVCGRAPLFSRVHKKGRKSGKDEITRNPRARSAIMRVAQRVSP